MSLFRKTVSIRCSGDKNSQCQNFRNKTPLPAHKRHCPNSSCGSSVIEDTVPNVPAIAALTMGLLVVSIGSIGYLFWQRLPNTPGGEEVVVLPLPPPSVDEIQNAIIKLEAMGTNKILEFPIKGKPNYMMVGFSDSNTNFGLTTKTVRIILQESLKNNGKFPEDSQITPILENKDKKDKQERSFDKKISKNEFLSRIVRAINNTKTIHN